MNALRRMVTAFLAVVAFLLVGAGGALAQTTWYVNGATGNDSNSGSDAAPFATINKAITSAADGDVIVIYAETYDENIASYNVKAVTFRAKSYQGNTVVTLQNTTLGGALVFGNPKSVAFASDDGTATFLWNDDVLLDNGSVDVGSSVVTVAAGRTITRKVDTGDTGVAFSGTFVFAGSVNVTYAGNANLTTGPELPSNLNGGTLTNTNTATVTADKNVTVANLNNTGTLDLGGNTLTIDTDGSGGLTVASVGTVQNGTVHALDSNPTTTGDVITFNGGTLPILTTDVNVTFATNPTSVRGLFTANGNVTVDKDLVVGTSTSPANFVANGNVTLNDPTTIEGLFTANGNTVAVNAVLSANGGINASANVNASAQVNVGTPTSPANFVTSGDVMFTGPGIINHIYGDFTFSGTTTVTGTAQVLVHGATTLNSVLIIDTGTRFVAMGNFTRNDNTAGAIEGAGTLEFGGTSNATFTPGTELTVQPDVTISKTATLTLNGSFTLEGSLDITGVNGVFDLNGNTVTFTENLGTPSVATSGAGASATNGLFHFEKNYDIAGSLPKIQVGSRTPTSATAILTLSNNATFEDMLSVVNGYVDVADYDLSPEADGASVYVYVDNAIRDASGVATGTFDNAGNTYNLFYKDDDGNPSTFVEHITALEVTNNIVDLTIERNVRASGVPSFTMAGALNVMGGGTLRATGSTVTLNGAGPHSVTGTVEADIINVRANGTVINGIDDNLYAATLDASVVIGRAPAGTDAVSATITDIQKITGALTVNPNDALTLGLAAPGAGDGEVQGAITLDGVSFTQTAQTIAKANVTVNSGTFDVGSYDFIVDGGTFTGATGVTYQGTGHIDLQNNATFGTNGEAVPYLRVTDDATLGSDVEVSAHLQMLANVDLGTNTFTLSGDADMASAVAFTNGLFKTAGTTITVQGNVSFDDFEVASTGTTTFASSSSIARAFTVNGDFTHTSGNVDLGNNTLAIKGDFTYGTGAGSWMQTPGTGYVLFNGIAAQTIETFDRTVTFVNLKIDNANGVRASGDDNVRVTAVIEVADGSLTTDNTDNDDIGDVILDDNVAAIYAVNDPLGTDADDVVLGNNQNVYYEGGATRPGVELPATVNVLLVRTTGAFNTSGRSVTANELEVRGTRFTIDANDTVTITDGGKVVLNNNGDIVNNGTFSATAYNLYFWSGNYPASGGDLDDEFISGATVDLWLNYSGVIDDLGGDRTVNNLNAASGTGIGLEGNTLTITGDATVGGNVFTNSGGAGTATILFAGNDAQTLSVPSAGLTLPGSVGSPPTSDPANLEINNAEGVTLDGGNLIMGNEGLLVLTDGIFDTGTNYVRLDHDGTGDDGFVQTGGAVQGYVRMPVNGTTSAETLEFPLGVKGSVIDRPVQIVLDNANTVTPNTEITVGHFTGDPGGNNGFPLMDGSLKIARYPDFYWTVETNVPQPSGLQYDLRFEAEGYSAFVGENINNVRLVTRYAGTTTNPWSLISGTYNNFQSAPDYPVVRVLNVTDVLEDIKRIITFGLESNFVATPPADFTLNAGDTRDFDLTTVFSGGTPNLTTPPTYTYSATSSDPAVATVSVTDDTLTVTAVSAGTATITVTATDRLNDQATASFTVTVNPALAASGTIADTTLNVGMSAEVPGLGSYFTGGTMPYTFSAASSDAAVATVSVSNDTLTVTAVGAGTATVTVTATDALGATATQSFTVTVNPALAASGTIADTTLNVGMSAEVPGLGSYFTGGTMPYTFSAASSDAAVATVSVSNDTLTVTAVGVGTATVTVTATDALGATATQSFTVTVNPALSVAAAPEDVTLAIGGTTTVDVSGVFTGGTGSYTLSASSSDAGVATVSLSGTDLTVTGVGAGTATITVTATDALGATASASFTATVLPEGDASGDGVFDVTDVVLALQHIVGSTTLTGAQFEAADFNDDGEVNVIDIVLMLQALSSSKTAINLDGVQGSAVWGEMTVEEGMVTVPVVLTGASDVYGLEMELTLPTSDVTFEGIETRLPEGWLVADNFDAESGVLRLAMAGLQPVGEGTVAVLRFRLAGEQAQGKVDGVVRLNGTLASVLDALEVRELPKEFALEQSYPNPFRTETTIKYQLPEATHVRVVVYDVEGRVVRTLVDGEQKAGYYRLKWDGRTDSGRPAAAGMYIYRIESPKFTALRKVVLVK